MNNNLYTKKTLIERVKDPEDNVSWEEFYNYYRPYVYVIVVNMGVTESDAQDVVQKIFVKAWNALPRFELSSRQGSFRAWISAITKNTVKTYFRDSSRRPFSTNTLENQALYKSPDINHVVEVEWKKFVVSKALENIKSEFSDKYISAFMRLIKGENIKQIATDCGIEESSLYVYRTRIQKRLCREIKKLNHELN